MRSIERVASEVRRPEPGWLAVAIGIVVLFVLALHGIAAKSFWYDEAMSLTYARMPLGELAGTLAGREANGTLYYLVLSLWRLLGEGETRVRFLSVLCAAATIVPLYLIGRRHVGVMAAALACLLFAIDPLVIEYTQDARMYTMATLLVTCAVLAWSFATATDRARWWVAYAVVAGAAVYTHLFAGFVVVGLGLTWLLGAVPRTRTGLVAQAALALLILPMVVFTISSDFVQVAWIRPMNPILLSVVLGGFAGGSLVLSWLFAAGIVAAIAPPDTARLRALAPIVAWALTPLLIGIAVSFQQSLLERRYFMVALPALMLLASAGFLRIGSAIGRERGRAPAAAIALAVSVVLVAGPLARWYESPRWDWRAAADWVARAAQPGDRVAYIPTNARYPLTQYLDRDTDRGPAEATIDELNAVPGRAWLVLYILRSTVYHGLEATLPGYEVVVSKNFEGVRVQLIEPAR